MYLVAGNRYATKIKQPPKDGEVWLDSYENEVRVVKVGSQLLGVFTGSLDIPNVSRIEEFELMHRVEKTNE